MALRSSILILGGALLQRALRVTDPCIRLTAWTAVLCGSLAIPALTAALPKTPLALMPAASGLVEATAVHDAMRGPVLAIGGSDAAVERQGAGVPKRFDWARAAVMLYVLVAMALVLRVCVGVAMSLRLLRSSHPTDRSTEGIEIRESDRVATPVTLGIARPAIVLPGDWSQWDGAKLEAVLAHERAHIRRHDPAVQLLSAIHRALLWHSPLSWFLHRRIVRVAEEASDDAAVAAIRDRASYAQVLLDFMQRGVRAANWLGVPMARYGRPDERIHRILDGTALPREITRWSVAAILALGSPLAYVVATAHPQTAPQRQATREVSMAPQIVAQAAPTYLSALGSVAAFYTVTVEPRVDGQLMSLGFREGDLVQAGQVLASIDPRPYRVQLAQAEGELAYDRAQLAAARDQNAIPKQQLDSQIAMVAQLEGKIKTDQAKVESAKLQLTYAQVTAPITGIVGLRMIDLGNIVHAADAGIVTIAQVQPIAVVFTISEDSLPRVLARLRESASMPVEAWNRDATAKIATGHLMAVDNQIDPATGTVKLKAVFDNKDGALFPNQFVNVRLLGNSQ